MRTRSRNYRTREGSSKARAAKERVKKPANSSTSTRKGRVTKPKNRAKTARITGTPSVPQPARQARSTVKKGNHPDRKYQLIKGNHAKRSVTITKILDEDNSEQGSSDGYAEEEEEEEELEERIHASMHVARATEDRSRFGYNCRLCIEGFLSPRMAFALECQA